MLVFFLGYGLHLGCVIAQMVAWDGCGFGEYVVFGLLTMLVNVVNEGFMNYVLRDVKGYGISWVDWESPKTLTGRCSKKLAATEKGRKIALLMVMDSFEITILMLAYAMVMNDCGLNRALDLPAIFSCFIFLAVFYVGVLHRTVTTEVHNLNADQKEESHGALRSLADLLAVNHIFVHLGIQAFVYTTRNTPRDVATAGTVGVAIAQVILFFHSYFLRAAKGKKKEERRHEEEGDFEKSSIKEDDKQTNDVEKETGDVITSAEPIEQA